MNNQRFFFDQDDSSHWYMIPAELRDKWRDANEMTYEEFSEESYKAQSEFERLFSEYRLPMHPTNFTFADPQEAE